MEKFKNYSEVHNHIGSFDAASSPEAHIQRELQLKNNSVCCTDHGSMTSCIEVYQLAKKNDLIPVLGVESYLRDDQCDIMIAAGIAKDKNGTFKDYSNYQHLTIHARDQKAFEFLGLRLSQADARAEVHGAERKPIFNWNDIEEICSRNVTVGSSCLIGIVGRHFLNGRKDLAEAYYQKMRGIVGPKNFLVEIFPHDCSTKYVSGVFIGLEDGQELKYWKGKKIRVEYRGKTQELSVEDLTRQLSGKNTVGWKFLAIKNRQHWEELPNALEIRSAKSVDEFLKNECCPDWPDGDVQLGMNKFVHYLASKYGDRIQISGDSHYASPEDHVVQDIKLINFGGGLRFTPGYHRQSSDEVYEYFHSKMGIDEKEFESWVDNSKEWVEGFRGFNLDSPVSLPTKFYPENSTKHLKSLIDKHGRMRWGDDIWVKRLTTEIELFRDNGTVDLLPYFFLAEELIDHYSKNRMLTGLARGSSGGTLIAYLLSITHIDPITWDLSLERFITLDRIKSGAYPDIDLDFSDRSLLLDPDKGYLWKRFGDHAAAISTNNMLHLKSSLKDVTRALHGSVGQDIEDLCKKIGNPPQGIQDKDWIFGYKSEDGIEHAGIFSESKDLQDFAEHNPRDWEITCKCCQAVKSRGRHACLPAGEPIFTVDGQKVITLRIEECNGKTVVTGQGRMATARLVNSGMKQVVEYTLSNGERIRATADHKVLTEKGWMTIESAFRSNAKLKEPMI